MAMVFGRWPALWWCLLSLPAVHCACPTGRLALCEPETGCGPHGHCVCGYCQCAKLWTGTWCDSQLPTPVPPTAPPSPSYAQSEEIRVIAAARTRMEEALPLPTPPTPNPTAFPTSRPTGQPTAGPTPDQLAAAAALFAQTYHGQGKLHAPAPSEKGTAAAPAVVPVPRPPQSVEAAAVGNPATTWYSSTPSRMHVHAKPGAERRAARVCSSHHHNHQRPNGDSHIAHRRSPASPPTHTTPPSQPRNPRAGQS
jgi:hypothetical protein